VRVRRNGAVFFTFFAVNSARRIYEALPHPGLERASFPLGCPGSIFAAAHCKSYGEVARTTV